MAAVDEIHKILGLAVAGGRGEVACYLITPASVKRELGERHKLDVSVAHLLNIRNKLVRELAVAVEFSVVIFAPRARVYLVNVDSLALVGMILFVLYPLAVVPRIIIDMIGARSVVGTGLAKESVGICFENALIPRSLHAVLVAGKFPNALDKELPYSQIGDAIHIMRVGIPIVKVAHYGNRFCIRSPNSEYDALTAVPVFKVRTEKMIGSSCLALQKLFKRGSVVINRKSHSIPHFL